MRTTRGWPRLRRQAAACVTSALAAFTLAGCLHSDEDAPETPVRLFIAVAQSDNFDNRKEALETFVEFAMKAPPGSEVVLLEGATARTVADVSIPDRPSMKLPSVRAKELAGQIGQARDYLSRAPSSERDQRLNIPKLANAISLQPASDLPARVALVGSPLYADPASLRDSMLSGGVPSLGHLCLARSESVYSARAVEGEIIGAAVYLLDKGAAEFKGREHRVEVLAFWRSYFETLGAVWGVSTDDKEQFVRAALDGAGGSGGGARVPLKCEDLKAEWTMYPRPPVTLPAVVDPEKAPTAESVRAEPPVGYVTLGIFWECEDCDFDLYARSQSGRDFLHYNHASSEDGVFYKDFTTNPKIPYGYEYIYFSSLIDLRQLEVLVNFYGAPHEVSPAEFTFRLQFVAEGDGAAEQLVERRFVFRARRGNRGEDFKRIGGGLSQYWARVDPLALLTE